MSCINGLEHKKTLRVTSQIQKILSLVSTICNQCNKLCETAVKTDPKFGRDLCVIPAENKESIRFALLL